MMLSAKILFVHPEKKILIHYLSRHILQGLY
jgi:hypothetical protein